MLTWLAGAVILFFMGSFVWLWVKGDDSWWQDWLDY
jgi:hypothetical protein